MRILLVADSHPDRLGASWMRALEALGHDLRLFDTTAAQTELSWPLRNRYAHRATIGSLTVRRACSRRFNEAIIDAVRSFRPEILAIHNGYFVMPETVVHARELGAWVAVFFADNPLPSYYAWRPETLKLARGSDRFLVWSERLAEKLRTLNIAGSAALNFAWDPVAFPYGPIPAAQRNEVVFVGNWEPSREKLLEAVATSFPIRIYGGPYWNTRTASGSRCRAAWAGRQVSGVEAAELFRTSAIVINPLREQHAIDGRPDGLIMRHFEVPGAGGFLLSTRSGGATKIFHERNHVVYFNCIQECCEMIEYYLSHPSERRDIAIAAHALTDGQHRYTHRMQQFVAFFEADRSDTHKSVTAIGRPT
jgi:spore maturation protein CgeB